VATNTSVEPLPDAFIAMAEIHLRNERFEEAEEAVGGARMAGAPYDKQYYLEGLIAENKKEFQAAEAYFSSALGEKPWKWTSAWMHLAESKMKQKKWLESLREFNELLKTDQPLKNEPLDRIYSDMGVCALAIGDHQGALDNWHRSLDYDNTNPETHINLGMMLETEKHYSAAIKEYKEAIKYLIERKPNDPRIQQLRNRIIKLEQMIKPSEVAPQRAKPSPYMRKRDEDQEGPTSPGSGKGNLPQGDSGF
jgi:tetratricopeptide (TPR) repeat protein